MSVSDIDRFIAWAGHEEQWDLRDVTVSRKDDATVTQVTMQPKDMRDSGACLRIVFIDGPEDSDCVIRMLSIEDIGEVSQSPIGAYE